MKRQKTRDIRKGYSNPNFGEIAIMIDNDLKKQKKSVNEDTIVRMEIQEIIYYKVKEGRKKQEIIDLLTQDTKYEKYSNFFESWIDHRLNKKIEDKQDER